MTLIIWFLAAQVHAQVAPECAGVQLPADYNDEVHRAFLQNYFAASTMLAPNGSPFLAAKKARLGLEASLIPPLSCEQRLVKVGSVVKTENTNSMPVLPRPRLAYELPRLGPVQIAAGFTIIPPIPLPFGVFIDAGGELAIGWTSPQKLTPFLRGHLNMAFARGEFATPFDDSAPSYDDLFLATTFGADLGLSYQIPRETLSWLHPFLTLGYASSRTIFIVGDDHQIVQNYKYPWHGATASLGADIITCSENCAISISMRGAFPILATVQASIAYIW